MTVDQIKKFSEEEFKIACDGAGICHLLSCSFCVIKNVGRLQEVQRSLLNEFVRRNPVKLLIEIEEVEVDTDPTITVYNIALIRSGQSWQETFGTADLANKFLRGVTAGASLFGNTVLSSPRID